MNNAEKIQQFRDCMGFGQEQDLTELEQQNVALHCLTLSYTDNLPLNFKIFMEEVIEYAEVRGDKDPLPRLSEGVDVLYTIYGDLIAQGFNAWTINEAFSRVHDANMSKLGDDGLPVYREDGKVTKGPNFKRADLTDLVK